MIANYKQFIKEDFLLAESKEEKNLHLTHLEDQVIDGGIDGIRSSINFLQALRDMLAGDVEAPVHVTTKWDGAPAIICGINPENGKFFVGTKGVFSSLAKLNYTEEDIDNNHPGAGLNKKLKIALRYLPELGIKNVIQGDMLYTHDDLVKEKFAGESLLTFRPNTITYAIPFNSELAQRIMASKMGIVFHTAYSGKTIAGMKASFGVNTSNLKRSKNVWFRDATFVDASGTANFTEDETKEITAVLSEAGNLFRSLSAPVANRLATNETFRILVNTYNNSHVRAGSEIGNTTQHVYGLVKFVEDKANKNILDAKKPDTKKKRELEKRELMAFFRSNANQLKLLFDMQKLLVRAKLMIIRKLQSVKEIGTFLRTDDGYRVTSPEGFVAIDHLGKKAVKLVDRMEFSRANFNAAKDWK